LTLVFHFKAFLNDKASTLDAGFLMIFILMNLLKFSYSGLILTAVPNTRISDDSSIMELVVNRMPAIASALRSRACWTNRSIAVSQDSDSISV
jgi:hypothetical protein